MASTALTREDGIGIALSVAGHVALLAILLFRPPSGDIVTPPDRIEVTLSDEVGLTSTSPEPFEAAAPDVAPEIGEASEVIEELLEPLPLPSPVRDTVRPEPQRPTPRPTVRPQPRPAATPPPKPRQASRPAPTRSERTGASRIGSDFLEGASASDSGSSSSPRAEAIGPRVRSALSGAITRQLKPHWAAPQGVDAEQLVTILSWSMNRDGSLSGTPRVVRQLGINDANSAQASRHAEQAVRAVQLAAPFNLPPEYYDGWKRVSAFRFDKRLSQ